MKMKLAALAFGLGAFLAVMPVMAHHSFAGTYLEDAAPVTSDGKLVQFLLRNPHSFVHVESKDATSGETIRWSIECGAAGQLAQLGVGREALKVGDMVKVIGSPGRNPADHRLRMRSITRPSDGWNWGNQGQTFN